MIMIMIYLTNNKGTIAVTTGSGKIEYSSLTLPEPIIDMGKLKKHNQKRYKDFYKIGTVLD